MTDRTYAELCALADRQLPELKSMPKGEFIGWLRDNPVMYRAFRACALEAVRKRRTRFSAYMIRERVRWYTNIEYGGEFKISNNITPYISRVLSLDIPVLEKIFARKDIDEGDINHTGELF